MDPSVSYQQMQHRMRAASYALPDMPPSSGVFPGREEAPVVLPADMHLEIKHLEERINKLGYQEIVEPGTAPAPEVYSSGKYGAWPMVILRKFSNDGLYRNSTLDIKSPYIKDVLADVIGSSYPGMNFRQKLLAAINLPARVFFFWMDEIEEACENLKVGGKRREHVELFVSWLKSEFADVKREMESLLKEGLMNFELFVPRFLILKYTTDYSPGSGQSSNPAP